MNNAFIKWIMYDNEKSTPIKKQEASSLLKNLGIKSPYIKIAMIGNISF